MDTMLVDFASEAPSELPPAPAAPVSGPSSVGTPSDLDKAPLPSSEVTDAPGEFLVQNFGNNQFPLMRALKAGLLRYSEIMQRWIPYELHQLHD